jgi:hypothetical protein
MWLVVKLQIANQYGGMPNETVLRKELEFYFVLGQVYVGCPLLLQAKANLRIRYDNFSLLKNNLSFEYV